MTADQHNLMALFCKHHIILDNIHSPSEEHFGCFPVLVIMGKLLEITMHELLDGYNILAKSGVDYWVMKCKYCLV